MLEKPHLGVEEHAVSLLSLITHLLAHFFAFPEDIGGSVEDLSN
jgi:hypothetical protein